MSQSDKIPAALRGQVLARDRYICARCGRGEALHAHHVVARVDGGETDIDNLMTLCAPCHMEWHMVEISTRMSFDDWMRLPNYHYLLATYQSLPAEMRDAANLGWQAYRTMP